MRTSQLAILSICTVLAGCQPNKDEARAKACQQRGFIELCQNSISTQHEVKLRVELQGEGYRPSEISDRDAEFNGHRFHVTLAGLLGTNDGVMVHAERVLDGSGASNYDDLPVADWPSMRFRYRAECVVIAPEDVAQEHDIAWLAENGWSPGGPTALAQYLTTSSDHNAEAIVSLVAKVSDCGDQAEINRAMAGLRAKLTVRQTG